MERKTGFELKQLDEKGQFVARVARLNSIDKDFDVTLPGAFGNNQTVPVVYAHRWDQGPPLGKARLTEEGDEVLARGQLNLAMHSARQLYEAWKFDAAHPPQTSQFSYGFSLKDFEHGVFQGQRVRFLKSVIVHEVSAVLAGAGDTALLAVKEDVSEATAAVIAEFHRLRERAVKLSALEEPEQAGACRYQLTAVPPRDVRHRVVRDAAKAAAAELNIEPPKSVLFFATAYSGDRVDFTMEQKIVGANWPEKHAIGVHVVQGLEELVESVRHEVGHLGGLSEEQCERFARKGAKLLADAPHRSPAGARSAELKSGRPMPGDHDYGVDHYGVDGMQPNAVLCREATSLAWEQTVAVAQYLRQQGIH